MAPRDDIRASVGGALDYGLCNGGQCVSCTSEYSSINNLVLNVELTAV